MAWIGALLDSSEQQPRIDELEQHDKLTVWSRKYLRVGTNGFGLSFGNLSIWSLIRCWTWSGLSVNAIWSDKYLTVSLTLTSKDSPDRMVIWMSVVGHSSTDLAIRTAAGVKVQRLVD